MPKVLLIDDDPNLRHILTRVLTKYDYEIAIAEDGASGLNVARQQKPDLIILDIIMPGMDGFEVAQRLHSDPVCARIPIMVLTAYATPYGRKMAVELGVEDFVTKPFGIDEIVDKVKSLTATPFLSPNQPTVPLPASGRARKICLHTLRGGLGCTSLAINVAFVLRNLWMRPTLLLDADFANGQLALALNQPDALTWRDLARANLQNNGHRLLDKRLVGKLDDLQILAASPNPKDADRLSAQVVGQSLRLLEQPYDYIVADLAHDLRPNTLEVLKSADVILHLLGADAVSLRLANKALAAYRSAGIRRDDVMPVLVDTRPGRTFSAADIETALGQPLAAYLPYSEMMVEAAQRGAPLVTAFPDQPLACLIEDLAYYLSKTVHKVSGPTQPTPTYDRVQGRSAAALDNGASSDIGGYMLKQAGIEN